MTGCPAWRVILCVSELSTKAHIITSPHVCTGVHQRSVAIINVILYLRAIFHKNWQFTFNNSTHNFSLGAVLLSITPYNLCMFDVCLLVCLMLDIRTSAPSIINQPATIVDTEREFLRTQKELRFRCVWQQLTPWPCSHCCEYIYKNCCLDYPPASSGEQCSGTNDKPPAQTTKQSLYKSSPLSPLRGSMELRRSVHPQVLTNNTTRHSQIIQSVHCRLTTHEAH